MTVDYNILELMGYNTHEGKTMPIGGHNGLPIEACVLKVEDCSHLGTTDVVTTWEFRCGGLSCVGNVHAEGDGYDGELYLSLTFPDGEEVSWETWGEDRSQYAILWRGVVRAVKARLA